MGDLSLPPYAPGDEAVVVRNGEIVVRRPIERVLENGDVVIAGREFRTYRSTSAAGDILFLRRHAQSTRMDPNDRYALLTAKIAERDAEIRAARERAGVCRTAAHALTARADVASDALVEAARAVLAAATSRGA